MRPTYAPPPAVFAVAIGMAALASAMGIGRFAFTPLLPLMQEAHALTLAQGAWLAGANYVGYFVGAMVSLLMVPRPGAAARWGLLAVAVTTLAMGVTNSEPAWLALRFGAGVASAFVLVGASGWAMAWLTSLGRTDGAGWVFAGVGSGIFLAGLVGLVAGLWRLSPAVTWAVLGAVAAAVAALTWHAFAPPTSSSPTAATASTESPRLDAEAVLWIVSYGIFGLGYIIPATFLPAVARSLVADPALFGLAWPVFGLAAAVSTIVVARRRPAWPARQLASRALWLMAAGVLAPVLHLSLLTVIVSALCVGGTFMVVTMAGLQEARRLARGGSSTRLASGMTAAFALGQLIGPLLVGVGRDISAAITVPSIAAALLLSASAFALQRGRRQTA